MIRYAIIADLVCNRCRRRQSVSLGSDLTEPTPRPIDLDRRALASGWTVTEFEHVCPGCQRAESLAARV